MNSTLNGNKTGQHGTTMAQNTEKDAVMGSEGGEKDPTEEFRKQIVEYSPQKRYVRFNEVLGRGAYKQVFRAYDTKEGLMVAWNTISLSGLPKHEKVRVMHEVRLLEQLDHGNVISFFGSWVNRDKEEVVFITEILSSGSLKDFIKKVQVIRWKIIKRWCRQILRGLNYLHSHLPPIIHRDLKCDNIFINGSSGDLRIGDLGLSTYITGKTAPLSVLGTPEFMAPELYDEKYDEKVDVYAFGMCVLEMISKETPYSECANAAQIYKRVTTGVPPQVLLRVRSEKARDFILACLQQDPIARPSVADLLNHAFLRQSDDDDEEVVVDPPPLKSEVVVVDGGNVDQQVMAALKAAQVQAQARQNGMVVHHSPPAQSPMAPPAATPTPVHGASPFPGKPPEGATQPISAATPAGLAVVAPPPHSNEAGSTSPPPQQPAPARSDRPSHSVTIASLALAIPQSRLDGALASTVATNGPVATRGPSTSSSPTFPEAIRSVSAPAANGYVSTASSEGDPAELKHDLHLALSSNDGTVILPPAPGLHSRNGSSHSLALSEGGYSLQSDAGGAPPAGPLSRSASLESNIGASPMPVVEGHHQDYHPPLIHERDAGPTSSSGAVVGGGGGAATTSSAAAKEREGSKGNGRGGSVGIGSEQAMPRVNSAPATMLVHRGNGPLSEGAPPEVSLGHQRQGSAESAAHTGDANGAARRAPKDAMAPVPLPATGAGGAKPPPTQATTPPAPMVQVRQGEGGGNVLCLEIRAKIRGKLRDIEFDFHLQKDDAQQVALEMVSELGLPQGDLEPIAKTVHKLAVQARAQRQQAMPPSTQRPSVLEGLAGLQPQPPQQHQQTVTHRSSGGSVGSMDATGRSLPPSGSMHQHASSSGATHHRVRSGDAGEVVSGDHGSMATAAGGGGVFPSEHTDDYFSRTSPPASVGDEEEVKCLTLLSDDDDEDLTDDEYGKLRHDYEKNVQRSQKAFSIRLENLKKSRMEKEESHRKQLEKHLKDMADFEKKVRTAEKEQQVRLKELEEQWRAVKAEHREQRRQQMLLQQQQQQQQQPQQQGRPRGSTQADSSSKQHVVRKDSGGQEDVGLDLSTSSCEKEGSSHGGAAPSSTSGDKSSSTDG